MSKMSFNPNIVLLQSCPGSHIIFYRFMKTSLFGTDPCNNHTVFVLRSFFNENENNDVKITISLISQIISQTSPNNCN